MHTKISCEYIIEKFCLRINLGQPMQLKVIGECSQGIFGPHPGLGSNKMIFLEFFSHLMIKVPDHFKAQGMCNDEVEEDPGLLVYTPDGLKTQEMCNTLMCDNPAAFFLVPDHFKTRNLYQGC